MMIKNVLIVIGISLVVGLFGYFVVGRLPYNQKQEALILPNNVVNDIDAVNNVEVLGWRKIEVASGGGFRGPWRMNESEFHFVDDPTVALSDESIIGVAWADQKKQDIFLQIYEKNGESRFDEPVNVSQSPGIFSWLPRMVFGDDNVNEVYILWQEIVFLPGGTHGGEIFFSRSIDGGRTFDRPINLSDTIAGEGKGRLTSRHWDNGSLDLAICPNTGNLYAAWTEFEGALRFSYSTDGGISFSTPRYIAGGGIGVEAPAPARGPSLTVDTEGFVYLVWTATRDRVSDIYFAKSTDNGRTFTPLEVIRTKRNNKANKPLTGFTPLEIQESLSLFKGPKAKPPNGPVLSITKSSGKFLTGFSKPIRLLTGSRGHLDAPRIVVDSKGVIHLVYAKSSDGLFGQYQIQYTNSNDGGETFKRSKEISAGIKDQWSAGFPVIDIDSQDNLYIVWEIFPDRGYPSRGIGFTFSNNGGQTFKSPLIVPNSANPLLGFNGSQQGLLMRKLAVNRAGMIAIVNSTFRANVGSHIWLYIFTK